MPTVDNCFALVSRYHRGQPISNPTPESGDQFGRAVALLDDAVIVGDPTDAFHTGTVYLFDSSMRRSLPFSLPNPTGTRGELFGASVAASGNVILVGAPLVDAGGLDAGAAISSMRPPAPCSERFTIRARVLF